MLKSAADQLTAIYFSNPQDIPVMVLRMPVSVTLTCQPYLQLLALPTVISVTEEASCSHVEPFSANSVKYKHAMQLEFPKY